MKRAARLAPLVACCLEMRSGAFHQSDQHQKNDRADGRMDDRGYDPASQRDTDRREQPAGNECADDADNDVAEQAETHSLDDQAGQPASDCADDDEDDKTFNAHVIPSSMDRRMEAEILALVDICLKPCCSTAVH